MVTDMVNDEQDRIFERVEKTIQRLVASNSNEEAKQVYADWQSYDEDLDAYGYVGPQNAVAILTRMLGNTDAAIYDAGCGSGRVGSLLAAAGYQNLTGADLSESMLQRAEQTGAYQQLKTADFSTHIDEPDNRFDGLISVGVWNSGFGEILTQEMIRVTRSGGSIVFSVRPQFMETLEPLLQELEAKRIINSVTRERADYITGQGSEAFYISFFKA